ncbi:PspA/IM30 family protein [Nocardia sp. NPDC049526]|uniref:PspA/IM30 family protein n=1 Tax=Nocardia sp. NPDC049526 TaxID=3364316 RepID=UPI00379C7CC7
MSDLGEITARLAALSDDELLAVLGTVTAGRPRLSWVHSAVVDATGLGHASSEGTVSPTTATPQAHDQEPSVGTSGQVGGLSPVPAVPVPPTGIPSGPEVGGYSPGGVPTFESVRDKVEQRFGTAQGMGELDRQTPAGRSTDEQWEAREKAARERLAQIRKSLHGNDVESNDP